VGKHCATVLLLQLSAAKVSYNITVAAMLLTNQKLRKTNAQIFELLGNKRVWCVSGMNTMQ